MATHKYAGHWERPEWIYAQSLQIEKRIATPEMVALKAKSTAAFQQKMAQEFPEFFTHYTKIFFRAINGKLNGPLFLMLLKQRQKMDKGEVAWEEGNHEVIAASFKLLLRKLPEKLQGDILETYKQLVDEEKEEMRKAIEEKMKEMESENVDEKQIEETIAKIVSAPQKIEVVSGEGQDVIDGVKAEVVKVESVKAESVKAESVKAESVKVESVKVESVKVESNGEDKGKEEIN